VFEIFIFRSRIPSIVADYNPTFDPSGCSSTGRCVVCFSGVNATKETFTYVLGSSLEIYNSTEPRRSSEMALEQAAAPAPDKRRLTLISIYLLLTCEQNRSPFNILIDTTLAVSGGKYHPDYVGKLRIIFTLENIVDMSNIALENGATASVGYLGFQYVIYTQNSCESFVAFYLL
jgi:hypothetical protein